MGSASRTWPLSHKGRSFGPFPGPHSRGDPGLFGSSQGWHGSSLRPMQAICVTGDYFPVGVNPLRLDSPCSSLVKPGVLAALHRASPVPFRGSYFTAGLHPPAATPQGLPTRLFGSGNYEQRVHSFIPSPRFRVAPTPSSQNWWLQVTSSCSICSRGHQGITPATGIVGC
jgi:hypothetical protein